jgi:hypothetical protein
MNLEQNKTVDHDEKVASLIATLKIIIESEKKTRPLYKCK